jgi:glycine reductase
MISVAKGVHANRIVEGTAIVNPVGNPSLPPEREREWRRKLIERALDALNREE